jgi:hypothetical protein
VLAEFVSRYWLAASYIPLEASHNGIQILREHGTEPKHVWQPPDQNGNILKHMRIHGYTERTAAIIDGGNSPRHRRLSAAASADLKIVADPFNPLTKTTFVDPATKVVNFVQRI